MHLIYDIFAKHHLVVTKLGASMKTVLLVKS